MIQQIMVYAIAVAVVLGVAGLALERLAALQGWPRRTAWIVALLLSVLLPPVMIQRAEPARNAVPVLLPPPQLGPFAVEIPVPRRAGSVSITSQLETPQPALQQSVPQPAPQPRTWHLPQLSDRALLQAWAFASLLSGLYLLGAKLRLRRQILGWQHATLLGQPVLISESMGPALLGVLRPRMVVPRWLLDESITTQSLILEHERQHIAARDPVLNRAGVVLLAALPWNLPLWWQWRRMRQAIELDCDARVLRVGVEPHTYGEVLLAITGRAARMPSGVLAMSEPVSALERRIQNLLPDPTRHAALQAMAAFAAVALSMGVAVAMNAPAFPVRPPEATLNELPMQRMTGPIAIPSAASTPPRTVMAAPANAPVVPATPGAARVQPGPAAPTTGAPDALGMSTRDMALRAAAQQYPELINGPALPGFYYVTIVVRADGTVFRSSLRAPLQSLFQGSPATVAFGRTFDRVTEGQQTAKIPKGQQIADVGIASNDIEALWRVLPTDYDESRDARRVIDVVQAKHDDLMLTSGEPLGSPMRNINLLTVLMTEDGQIARQAVELLDSAQYLSLNPRPVNGEAIVDASGGPYTSYNPPSVPAEAFKVLGLGAEQIGKTGFLLVRREPISSERLRSMPLAAQREMSLPHYLLVRYAWPRRPGEPIGGKVPGMAAPTVQRTQFVPSAPPPVPQASAPIDSTSRLDKAMRAMVQKYPDLISGPEMEGGDSLSMAVTRDGRVIYSGLLGLSMTRDSSLGSDGAVSFTANLFTSRSATAIPDTGRGTAFFPKGEPVAGAGIASRNILANYYMLPADYDESRGIAKVINAVREQHNDLMLTEVGLLWPEPRRTVNRQLLANRGQLNPLLGGTPQRRPADPPPKDTQLVNLLTVFMTEDGKIARYFVEQKRAEELQSALPLPVDEGITMNTPPYNSFNPPPVPAEAFKVLGLDSTQIGPTGYVIVQRKGTVTQPVNMIMPPGVVVRYAWPRRAGEPIGGR